MNAKALRLKGACEYAIKRWVATEDATWCNVGTSYIAKVAGFDGFKGMIANEMINLMKRSPDFVKVTAPAAQTAANDGKLVIAGRMDEPHGHVAVVLPGGALVNSGKWHEEAPTVANVGRTNGIMGSNWAFSLPPSYWVWLEPSNGKETV